jgi:hypothetical protein
VVIMLDSLPNSTLTAYRKAIEAAGTAILTTSHREVVKIA